MPSKPAKLSGERRIALPPWAVNTINGWVDPDHPTRTMGMDEAGDWGEIRGRAHGQKVLKELSACIADCVLEKEFPNLYAVYGWITYRLGRY